MTAAFVHLYNAEFMAGSRFRSADKVAFGNRETEWHRENGENLMAFMKAGVTVTALPMAATSGARAVYAAGRYMYTHPIETITVIKAADGAYGGTPPNSVASSMGKLADELGLIP
jgi:hypothetical protein